jgi:hypothetical protein
VYAKESLGTLHLKPSTMVRSQDVSPVDLKSS